MSPPGAGWQMSDSLQSVYYLGAVVRVQDWSKLWPQKYWLSVLWWALQKLKPHNSTDLRDHWSQSSGPVWISEAAVVGSLVTWCFWDPLDHLSQMLSGPPGTEGLHLRYILVRGSWRLGWVHSDCWILRTGGSGCEVQPCLFEDCIIFLIGCYNLPYPSFVPFPYII